MLGGNGFNKYTLRMSVSLVMTIIGPDKPAIVDALATLVANHGGNWLESRMMHLGGQFAGILRVDLPAEAENAFRSKLPDLESRGLKVVVHSEPPERAALSGKKVVTINLVGQDRPGIVQQISRALALSGGNVEELESECSSAPMSGETLFKARLEVSFAESAKLDSVRSDLEKIASDLMVELSFE
jgi:glycine cleavage system regulatory protein